ncbi:TraR/DksA family transcriptional regulator [Branchiibius hedensis]|uniref:TraR/DksA family transcriptional regulator n=1 Tax=Branchiibius hedensis TaxID=672460 RepID=UPI0015AA576B|nr:TraR/DksA C4-type zinc finger protein [Branchiibius hedensis]
MKAASTKKATANQAARQAAASLLVAQDESPWTPSELAQVAAELRADVDRLRGEVAHFEHDFTDLIKGGGDGAGDDQADVGTMNVERDHELSLADNSRAMLEQSQHALERIADGSYGICESCGKAVGKLRLQAFPRATLCMACKQKQERR